MNSIGWYRAGREVTQAAARLLLRMDVVRRGQLPVGPKIIAPNHPTTIDPFLVPAYIDERVHILVTESAFKVPGFGAYLRAAGHIPVFAGEGKRAFEAALKLLCEGHNVVIFPEGALSPLDGSSHKAHTGVARLALRSGAAVIPVGIGLEPERIRFINTGIVNAAGEPEVARVYAHGRYVVALGSAMRMTGDVEDREHVRALSDQIMAKIGRLRAFSTQRVYAPHTRLRETSEFPAL